MVNTSSKALYLLRSQNAKNRVFALTEVSLMSLKLSSSVGLIGCALSLTLVTAAQAQQAATAAPSQSEVGMRVSIDPATREIRPVTADEAATLDRQDGKAAKSAQRSKPVTLTSRATGAKGVRLGEEHMSYATVTRAANGQLQMECTESGNHAGHDHAAPATAREESNLE
jgi:hypothetical protein